MNDLKDMGTLNEASLTESLILSPEISSSPEILPKSTRAEIAKKYQEDQKDVITLLYEEERENNTLTKAQFLIDKEGIDKNAHALQKQARQINRYLQINENFLIRQQEVLEYLSLIRIALKDTSPTIENLRDILITWRDQLVDVQQKNAGIEGSHKIYLHPASKIEIPRTSEFLSFLGHCLNEKASKIILEAIAFEITNTKPDNELTQEDLDLAQAQWNQKIEEKYKRLKNHVTEDVITKIKNWYEQVPLPLTKDENETIELNNPHPYHPEESKKERELRIQYISGCAPRREQLNKACVVRSLEQTAKKDKISSSDPRGTYVKRMCELPDNDRVDMQKNLGIIPISRSRDTYWGAFQSTLGSLNYQTDFKGARLDPNQPLSFKERKKLAVQSLTPLFDRRHKERPHVEEALSKAEDPDTMLSSVISEVRKLKL